jgi:hypothetical protein
MTTFELLILMLLFSMIAWAMPMVRQANSSLFFYFYTIALADPIVILLTYFRVLNSNEILTFFATLNFVALKNLVVNKKLFYTSISVLTLFFIFVLFTTPNYFLYLIIVNKFFNLIVFLLYTLRFVAATSNLNIFHLMLLFYEATLITKIIVMINYTETAFVYFVVTSLFQVLIAIWFTIFKEDNPKLHLNLRNI